MRREQGGDGREGPTEAGASPAGVPVDAILLGLDESGAAICLCDEADVIRYANARFRAAFFPQFDGHPSDFMTAIIDAMAGGTGIRLVSAMPQAFADATRRRRRAFVGSQAFATDLMDGSWWRVTDTKLSNGWILAVAQDISALKHEEAKLRDAHASAVEEASTDFLTGVPNRRHGLRQAEALWRSRRAAGLGLSVALIDVDHFKAINDIYGHETGDRALVHFCRHMTAAIAALNPETPDQFSRIGGDEFLLLQARTEGPPLDAALAAILAGLPPLALDGGADRLRLSVSVGIAASRPGDSWPGLMHRADMALYDAKAGGRDRIALAG